MNLFVRKLNMTSINHLSGMTWAHSTCKGHDLNLLFRPCSVLVLDANLISFLLQSMMPTLSESVVLVRTRNMNGDSSTTAAYSFKQRLIGQTSTLERMFAASLLRSREWLGKGEGTRNHSPVRFSIRGSDDLRYYTQAP